MTPLLLSASDSDISTKSDEHLKTETIFSNVRDILAIHHKLMDELDQRVSSWSGDSLVGDLFLYLTPGMSIYNTYGSNYESSLEVLRNSAKNVAFMARLQACQEGSQKKLKLESLLIQPIQRVPRYILLLSDLLRNTPEDHPDRELIDRAIKEMQRVADELNKNVHHSQFKSKFSEIAQKGAKGLVQKGRIMLFEGTARCENKKKPIAVFLFNDLFIHLSETRAKNKANLLLPAHQWPLSLIWLTQDEEFVCIKGPTDSYRFRLAEMSELLPQLSETVNSFLMGTCPGSTIETDLRKGTFTFPETSASFTGEWKRGKMANGRMAFNGNVYHGTFKGGLKSGEGNQISSFGDTFTGQWLSDRPHGTGTMKDAVGNEYVGAFDCGVKCGQGTMKYANGASYQGTWAHDHPEGSGLMTFASGSIYEGNWEGGRFHQSGTLSIPNKLKYEGAWSYGLREGNGRQEHADSSVFEGTWRADLREGNGTETTSLGTYEGEWLNDLKEGKGTMRYQNGDVYNGSWRRGSYHGSGKLTLTRSATAMYDGEWYHGRKHGKGFILFRNGDSFDGFFRDDAVRSFLSPII